MPAVSIIMPAFKAAAYVGQSIRSVQAQTFVDWELLIVDDGSPDDTFDRAHAAAAGDPRIRIMRQANAGPAMARQTAIDAASGRFIAFLDSDDLWLPQKLENQYLHLRETKCALSYTEFRRINADGSVTGHLITVPERITYYQLLGNTIIATSTVLLDRDKTGPIRMTKTYYDDFVLWLALLKRGCEARGLKQDLMRYRVLQHSVSRNKLRSARKVWVTYRDIEQLSLPVAGFSFARYAWHAYRKYREF